MFVSFTKGINFYDYLFDYLDDVVFQNGVNSEWKEYAPSSPFKMGLTLKGKNLLPNGEQIPSF